MQQSDRSRIHITAAIARTNSTAGRRYCYARQASAKKKTPPLFAAFFSLALPFPFFNALNSGMCELRASKPTHVAFLTNN